MSISPFLLCILDGVGLNPKTEGNAVSAADTPTLDRLFATYPHTTLTTFGTRVGLPEGQMGNSEVGHLNIGAGRVVKQWLVRIGDAFSAGEVKSSSVLQAFLTNRQTTGKVHLIGLFSFGGVHSDAEHLFSLTKVLTEQDPDIEIVLHLITDGRDTAPKQFVDDLPALETYLNKFSDNVTIGSISGRFFAMDRDRRWKRTEQAYNTIVAAESDESEQSPIEAVKNYIESQHSEGTTDEFIVPKTISGNGITADDSILFWNFRSDRMRQIVQVFTDPEFTDFNCSLTPFAKERILCFTEYDSTFSFPVLFPPQEIAHHLGSVLAQHGLQQLRVAETEKYPHVTYFLNGGIEEPENGEERILLPSPRDVKTYDQKPEMSAYEVTDKVLEALDRDCFRLVVLNFANGDMVGHTGNIPAATRAVEVVDECLGKILEKILEKGGEALVIADHGNAEQMIDYETGEPHTAHTTHPVPALLVSDRHREGQLRKDGALCDVAPTILQLIEVEQPEEMTGTSLLTAH